MNYLKYFELYQKNPEEDIDIGDYIVLLKADVEDTSKGFKEGGIYKIISINHHKYGNKESDLYIKYPYKILNEENISKTKFSEYWYTQINIEQFRKATPEEVEALKYNL